MPGEFKRKKIVAKLAQKIHDLWDNTEHLIESARDIK